MTSSYLIPKTEEAKGSCDRKYKHTTVFAFQVSSFSFQHASLTLDSQPESAERR